MGEIHRYLVKGLQFPADEKYNYCVQKWTSEDNGKSFYYCGERKYFETLEAARAYQREKEGAQA